MISDLLVAGMEGVELERVARWMVALAAARQVNNSSQPTLAHLPSHLPSPISAYEFMDVNASFCTPLPPPPALEPTDPQAYNFVSLSATPFPSSQVVETPDWSKSY